MSLDIVSYAFLKNMIKSSGGSGVSQRQIDNIATSIGLTTPSDANTILNGLKGLIANSNQTTNINDTNISGAVNTLIGGYGKNINNNNQLSKGVNFIDYDGSIVTTWETSTVASKTALPDNPTHDGLTAQGWNWSLDEIQSYIADYPDALVTVGQMYITDDGKTRIYIHLEEGRLSPYLGICLNGSVDIDWGDGSEHDIVTSRSMSSLINTQHTYTSGGDYVISLTVTGSMGIVGNNSRGSQLLWKNSTSSDVNIVYQSAIQKVIIGDGVKSIGNYAFKNCYSLKSVIIPSGVTQIEGNAFYKCYSLTSATIPNSVTRIDSSAFDDCYSLKNITIPSSVTSIGTYAFYYCYSLTNITIPSSVTSIGTYTFSYCYSLTNITIPSSVTSIGTYAFYCCYSLGFIKFTKQTPPTVSSSNAWSGIPTDCIIYVPAGTLSAYTSATNYPSPSTYTYVEY